MPDPTYVFIKLYKIIVLTTIVATCLLVVNINIVLIPDLKKMADKSNDLTNAAGATRRTGRTVRPWFRDGLTLPDAAVSHGNISSRGAVGGRPSSAVPHVNMSPRGAVGGHSSFAVPHMNMSPRGVNTRLSSDLHFPLHLGEAGLKVRVCVFLQ